MKLKAGGVAPLEHLAASFSDGVALIQLLELISDESLGRYNKKPKLRIQKIENVNKALAFIKGKVQLTNIGAEGNDAMVDAHETIHRFLCIQDLVDANDKLVLGMIWTIILRFTIAEIR